MAKKKTVKKKAAPVKTAKKTSKKRPKKKPEAQSLNPKAGEVLIRVYRQGLGDCYLLAFGGKPTRHVLIDCGIHSRQTKGNERLLQVMTNLAQATRNHLDVVVATHEHADHLSGFVQKQSPFLKENFSIGKVWLAWTEDRKNPTANDLRKKRKLSRAILEKAIQQAQARANQDPALGRLAEEARDLVSFEQISQEAVDEDQVIQTINALAKRHPGKADILKPLLDQDNASSNALLGAADQRKIKPTSNELALGLLMMKGQPEFLQPGDVAKIPDIEGVRAYVLGPPRRDLALLKKDRPSKIRGSDHEYKETYLNSMQSGQSFALSPALYPTRSETSNDLRFPFAKEFHNPVDVASNDPTILRYHDPREAWRRIDGDWLRSTEQLALNLDNDTNNTSLVLALELGKPGEGPVLLFPGDAQVGNWLSWRNQEYHCEGASSTADDLMARTLFYKVGHHGSHNATVKRDPREPSPTDELGVPFGLELMRNIIAAIPVDRDAADKKMPTPWAMPHQPLYKRLREKASRRVLRADDRIEPLRNGLDEPDVVPPTTSWTDVPGLPRVKWRRSSETFHQGTPGPLFYDVLVAFA